MPILTTTNKALWANCPNAHFPGASNSNIASRSSPKEAAEEEPIPDIECVPVNDDPRKWSHIRKTTTLWIVSIASLITTLASNIQNPTNALIEQDLHASSVQISWSLAVSTLVSGTFPLFWSAASEIKGRKPAFIAAITIFVLACVILANAQTIHVLIGMRVVQAAGYGAAITTSATTLADIYETHERGTMMGIFYAVPLLGPALAPIIGGCLAQAFGWRAIFYFLAACGGIILGAFIFLFKDSFRIERSLTYQAALRRQRLAAGNPKSVVDPTVVESKAGTEEKQASKNVSPQPSSIENGAAMIKTESGMNDVRLSFSDINPFPPLWMIMRRRNNLAILLANGLVFAFSYCLSYTCARTLNKYYGYGSLSVGIVLLSLGAGSIGGSLIGGRWSDHIMMKMKTENEGKCYPEVSTRDVEDRNGGSDGTGKMRLKSATLAMVWLPLSVIGYGWVAETHVNVGVVCLMLFLCGFFSIWMYASTWAYLVDANPGRTSSAVATNSTFRGALAFVSTIVAVPLQDAVGDGWLYTGFAGLVIVMELLVVLVMCKGASWREHEGTAG